MSCQVDSKPGEIDIPADEIVQTVKQQISKLGRGVLTSRPGTSGGLAYGEAF